MRDAPARPDHATPNLSALVAGGGYGKAGQPKVGLDILAEAARQLLGHGKHDLQPHITLLPLSALIGLMVLESVQMAADILEGLCVSGFPGQTLGALEPVYSLLRLPQLEGTASRP
jgi:hypothetical protein